MTHFPFQTVQLIELAIHLSVVSVCVKLNASSTLPKLYTSSVPLVHVIC